MRAKRTKTSAHPVGRVSRRSRCPLNATVEILGDRWSLLILRDMMLRGRSNYQQLLQCDEKIATNILADRLKSLQRDGIIVASADPTDARRQIYRLTQKGIDLAPVLTEMVLWAGKHEKTDNRELIELMQKDKPAFLEQIRRQWASKSL